MKWYVRERMSQQIDLTVEERRVKEELHRRADKLRSEYPDMPIADAIYTAVIQMGLSGPDEVEEFQGDDEACCRDLA